MSLNIWLCYCAEQRVEEFLNRIKLTSFVPTCGSWIECWENSPEYGTSPHIQFSIYSASAGFVKTYGRKANFAHITLKIYGPKTLGWHSYFSWALQILYRNFAFMVDMVFTIFKLWNSTIDLSHIFGSFQDSVNIMITWTMRFTANALWKIELWRKDISRHISSICYRIVLLSSSWI